MVEDQSAKETEMAFGNRLSHWIYNHSPASIQDMIVTVYSRGRRQVKYGPKFYEYLTDLERTQWYTNEQLEALQDEKVRRLVWYVMHYVPYYRALFQELSIRPQDIRSVDDMVRLPLLEKNTVQLRLDDFWSLLFRDPHSVEPFQSSGTTGKALDVYVTHDCLQMEKAFSWLHRSWGGIKPGDRQAAFVGFPVVPVGRKRPPFLGI